MASDHGDAIDTQGLRALTNKNMFLSAAAGGSGSGAPYNAASNTLNPNHATTTTCTATNNNSVTSSHSHHHHQQQQQFREHGNDDVVSSSSTASTTGAGNHQGLRHHHHHHQEQQPQQQLALVTAAAAGQQQGSNGGRAAAEQCGGGRMSTPASMSERMEEEEEEEEEVIILRAGAGAGIGGGGGGGEAHHLYSHPHHEQQQAQAQVQVQEEAELSRLAQLQSMSCAATLPSGGGGSSSSLVRSNCTGSSNHGNEGAASASGADLAAALSLPAAAAADLFGLRNASAAGCRLGVDSISSMPSVYDAIAAARSTLYHSNAATTTTNPYASLQNSGLYSGLVPMGILQPTLQPQQVGVVVFTPGQLRELQHQALVLKYIMNGVNVPLELINPLLVRSGVGGSLSSSSSLSLSPSAHLLHHHHLSNLPWGGYRLGFGVNADPEPGRCRRTDGKKWRCSRDVVPDQKYCERHIHRGRHRARGKLNNPETTNIAQHNNQQQQQNVSCSLGGLSSVVTSSSNMSSSIGPPVVSSAGRSTTRALTGGGLLSGVPHSHQQNLPQIQHQNQQQIQQNQQLQLFQHQQQLQLQLQQQQQSSQQQQQLSSSSNHGIRPYNSASPSEASGASVGSSVTASHHYIHNLQQPHASSSSAKDSLRYMTGISNKSDLDLGAEQMQLFAEASGGTRAANMAQDFQTMNQQQSGGLNMLSSINNNMNSWRTHASMQQSRAPSPSPTATTISQQSMKDSGQSAMMQYNSPQLRTLVGRDFNPMPTEQSGHQHHQYSNFLGGGYGSVTEVVTKDQSQESQPLRHFFDDWPRSKDASTLSWSDVEDEKPHHHHRNSSTTQLSISIPISGNSSDFNNTTSGSSNDPGSKLKLSPLKLSMSRGGEDEIPLGVELGVGMGLGIHEDHRNHNHHHDHGVGQQNQANWIPIAWETPVGGPLAEVLQSSTPRSSNKNLGGLNLMTEGWEESTRGSSPLTSSSPSRDRKAASNADVEALKGAD